MSATRTITIAKYRISLKGYRHYLKRRAKKATIIKRKDNRIKNIHYCNGCGKLLSGYNPEINKYVVYRNYYKLIMANKETYYICYNDKACQNYLQNKKGTHTLIVTKVVN